MGFSVSQGSMKKHPHSVRKKADNFQKMGPPLVQTAGWGCAPERCQLGKPHSPGVRASYSKAESDKDRKQRPGRAQPVRFVCHPSPNGCFYLLNTSNTHWTSVLPEQLHEFIFISTVTLVLMLNKLWFISSKPILTGCLATAASSPKDWLIGPSTFKRQSCLWGYVAPSWIQAFNLEGTCIYIFPPAIPSEFSWYLKPKHGRKG